MRNSAKIERPLAPTMDLGHLAKPHAAVAADHNYLAKAPCFHDKFSRTRETPPSSMRSCYDVAGNRLNASEAVKMVLSSPNSVGSNPGVPKQDQIVHGHSLKSEDHARTKKSRH